MVDVVDSAVVVFSLFPTFRKSRRMRPVGPGATAGQFRSLTSCISFHFAETFFYRLVSLGNTSAGRNGIIGQIISSWRQSFGMKICTEKEAEIFVQLFEDRFFLPSFCPKKVLSSNHFILKFCPLENRTKFRPEIQAYFWAKIIRPEKQFRPTDVLPLLVKYSAPPSDKNIRKISDPTWCQPAHFDLFRPCCCHCCCR